MLRDLILFFACFLAISLAYSQETGQLYFSDDQGDTWRRADTGLPETVVQICLG